MANDQKEKDYNPSQKDYEAKFDSAGTTNSSGHDSDENANLSTREAKPDGSHDDVDLRPEEQAKIDQMESGLSENNLYDPSGAQQHHKPSLQSRIKGLANTRGKKAGWIGGGIVGLLLGGFLTLFPVLGPVHIFSNLMDHNFEFNDSFRRNRTGRIVDSILNRNRTNRNLRDTPFSTKTDLIEFERFETRMQSSGWSFEYNADGRATGLIDPDGNRVGLDNTSRSEFRQRVQPLIDDNVPAWRMNKRVRTRSLISTFTGPRRSFSWSSLLSRNRTAEPDFEVSKFKKQAGIDDVDIDGRIVVRDVDATEGDSPLDRALQETVDAKLEGASDTDAIYAGVAEAKDAATPDGGRTSVVVGSVILGCIAYTVNQNELVADYERYAAALRYGATFMLATNEVQQGGDIDVAEVGQLFGDFNNFDSTTVSATDLEESVDDSGNITYSDTGEPIDIEYNNNTGSFAEAAAWQRATGSEVTGPEINPEFRVIQTQSPLDLVDGIMGMLATVGGLVAQIPGFGLLCDAVFSPIGFIVGIAFDLIEGIAAVAACFTGAGCVALSKFAVIELFWEVGSRMISAAMTAFVGFLTDNPVQSLAILDQSLNLTASEESRTAQPVQNEVYNAQVLAYKQERTKDLPFSERYFALDNANSMAANLARFKMGVGNYNIPQTVAKIFSLPGNSIIAAATSQNVYAQSNLDFDNYGFQKYTYDNAFLDDDPFELAEDVSDMIEADLDIYLDNGDDKSSGEQYARDFAVMCMGYVPEQGLVVKRASNQDFLPRFSDPETTDAERRNAAFNKVCLQEANEFADTYAKIGRFVDDIELISSIIELSGEKVPATGGTTTAPGTSTPITPPDDTSPEPPPVCGPDTPPDVICIP